ncbi:dihydroneopterin aldolase [Arenibacter sp. GZD96]|uniref:dihydroneopterin aldolase n=1 Tax=Aurantibrevibacter litoralis TaxID=3106030 RepID=UPI002AFF6630|nr:dihydroneopterin aldolase [Arenibacter sp. GZD-96]MEA1786478.1 dihydroneopterin aldolase [Arenibacter sp. GZD-96]
MGIIQVNGIRLYAHHGCLEEETLIGSAYEVHIEVKANLANAALTDRLADTVDYVHIHELVKEEMRIPSKLLEHVAQRILHRILKEHPLVEWGRVAIAKINPPIGGDVKNVSVVLKAKRKKCV